MSEAIERRTFLRGAGALGALGLAACGREPSAPAQARAKPCGTPWWLAASRDPGQHTLLELPYPPDKLGLQDPAHPTIKGISPQVVAWHHEKHHAGYVRALNEIEKGLAAANPLEADADYSPFTEMKRRETFNASGMVLHDLYWLNLTPGGAALPPGADLAAKLTRDFGSLQRWRDDFVGTALTANTGWAILALSPNDLKLHNYACSFHDLGGVWGAIPLIACDVWEHAYYFDYGPDRASYLESFQRLLNWPLIDETFRRWAGCGVLP